MLNTARGTASQVSNTCMVNHITGFKALVHTWFIALKIWIGRYFNPYFIKKKKKIEIH